MKIKSKHYIVFDKVSGQIILSLTSQNDTLAVRDSLMTMRVPLKDCELYQVADIVSDFDSHSNEIKFGFDFKYNSLSSPRFVSWSCYKFPESPAEALAPLGLSNEELNQLVSNEVKNDSRSDVQKIVNSYME